MLYILFPNIVHKKKKSSKCVDKHAKQRLLFHLFSPEPTRTTKKSKSRLSVHHRLGLPVVSTDSKHKKTNKSAKKAKHKSREPEPKVRRVIREASPAEAASLDLRSVLSRRSKVDPVTETFREPPRRAKEAVIDYPRAEERQKERASTGGSKRIKLNRQRALPGSSGEGSSVLESELRVQVHF